MPEEEEEAGRLLTQHVDLGASQEGCGSVPGCGHGRQRHPDVLEHVVVLQVVVRPQVRSHPTSRIDSVVWTGPRNKKNPQNYYRKASEILPCKKHTCHHTMWTRTVHFYPSPCARPREPPSPGQRGTRQPPWSLQQRQCSSPSPAPLSGGCCSSAQLLLCPTEVWHRMAAL